MAHIHHVYKESPGGGHDWHYWDKAVKDMLEVLRQKWFGGNHAPIKIKNRQSLTGIQWADSISFHDSTASDADVFEQLMLFVRLVRHIWRVMAKQ